MKPPPPDLTSLLYALFRSSFWFVAAAYFIHKRHVVMPVGLLVSGCNSVVFAFVYGHYYISTTALQTVNFLATPALALSLGGAVLMRYGINIRWRGRLTRWFF